MTRRFEIVVSGKAYHAACDPKVSSVPTEERWPAPTLRKRGRGVQAVYLATEDDADLIASHLEDVGASLMYDVSSRAEARACLRDADRIRLTP